jgi:hypothetical protein
VLSRRNFPRVLFNVVVGGVEVDAYFPDQGVIVEVDGPVPLRSAGVRVRSPA